jgi:hypothetical protein
MAGAGAKKFPAFSKLSSNDVNNYLADQVIMRFATTTARDAAFGGLGEPTLAEGMTAYIDNLNVLQTYDGSNWVTTTALQTTPDVSAGLVYLAGGNLTSSATDFLGVFSSQYTNYRVVVSQGTLSAATDFCLNFLLGASPVASNAFYYGYVGLTSGGAGSNQSGAGIPLGRTGAYTSSAGQMFVLSMDIYAPNVNTWTRWAGQAVNQADLGSRSGGGHWADNTQFTGLRLQSAGGQTITGQVEIYGYRKV